ncbi:MAG: GntR family transcriptional regulator [Pseudomonadota bacterium]
MELPAPKLSRQSLSAQIAEALRAAILEGKLKVDARLPSEAELASRFGVSRPTVREALKRLAAQNLIRTTRGTQGGAFVARMGWEDARAQAAMNATLLISLHNVDFAAVCQARFALETAALPLVFAAPQPETVKALRRQIVTQSTVGLSDEAFCASDVAFHLTLIEATQNPVLSHHAGAAVEAMQPLMNMITFQDRDRCRIVDHHRALADALEAQDLSRAREELDALTQYTQGLWRAVQ